MHQIKTWLSQFPTANTPSSACQLCWIQMSYIQGHIFSIAGTEFLPTWWKHFRNYFECLHLRLQKGKYIPSVPADDLAIDMIFKMKQKEFILWTSAEGFKTGGCFISNACVTSTLSSMTATGFLCRIYLSTNDQCSEESVPLSLIYIKKVCEN